MIDRLILAISEKKNYKKKKKQLQVIFTLLFLLFSQFYKYTCIVFYKVSVKYKNIRKRLALAIFLNFFFQM